MHSAEKKGQLTESCIREAIKYKKAPLVIWGGLTGLLQPADTYQIKKLKALYRTHEQLRLIQYQSRRPDYVPQMQGQDVVAAAAKAWGEMVGGEGYALGLKTAFAKTGITAPLDGSGDHEIAEEVRAILEDGRGSNWGGKPCSFFEWRLHHELGTYAPFSSPWETPFPELTGAGFSTSSSASRRQPTSRMTPALWGLLTR